MVQSVFIIGAVMLVITLVLNIIFLKAFSKSTYACYYPSMVFSLSGLLFLLVATYEKIEVLGAGMGGWGIAFLFASAIGFIVTSILAMDNPENA
ncbi:MAG TPA: hypothetical protein VK142_06675 [Bacillota bacterium]|nr:hypothetical protein [Bacillota bacterium]